jgi:Glycosyl transferase family 2
VKQRILIGSPVRQTPRILDAFLRSLSELHTDGIELSFDFVDDNVVPESRALLRAFSEAHPRCRVHHVAADGEYVCDATTHHWNERLTRKVATFKDRIIGDARSESHDHLFLVDSDLVLPPQLLRHLASLNKAIVSEVFWTMWQPELPMLPQVWLRDRYTLFPHDPAESLTEKEALSRTSSFLKQLRRPGQVQVGGLGACTLISRSAIERGVNFSEIDNLSMPGEDRHFCIRARALDVELWADTRFPPLHLYREADLLRLEQYRARFAANFLEHPKLTLSMVVHNEANRWLAPALRAHRPFIQEAVVIDDASTDNTVDVVQRELDGLPLRLIRNHSSKFSNEIDLRRQQWDEAVASNPDWLLILDADEVLEPGAATVIPQLVKQTDYAVFGFELYDFWSPTHYREDTWWCAHRTPRPFLTRYNPDFRYLWSETAQHCGRMPANALELNSAATNLRVKHYGWADPAERARKHARYQALDPDARFGIREQYDSILDPSPTLLPWQE